MLLVKIFSLKNQKKTNQTLSATLEQIKFCQFKKTAYGYFRQEIAMGNCKTKAVQADLGTFMHITAYSDIFRGITRYIQDLFRHIHAYSEPCVTLTYLERWYIWSPGIFRILS